MRESSNGTPYKRVVELIDDKIDRLLDQLLDLACNPPSVVGHDGRAEGNTAATVGPPVAAPAPEDEKPGENARHSMSAK